MCVLFGRLFQAAATVARSLAADANPLVLLQLLQRLLLNIHQISAARRRRV